MKILLINPTIREHHPPFNFPTGMGIIAANVKIVLGGGVTIEPELIFGNMPVDFCVHGEGEHTFCELCAAMEEQERDFSRIAGISYIEKDKVVSEDSSKACRERFGPLSQPVAVPEEEL